MLQKCLDAVCCYKLHAKMLKMCLDAVCCYALHAKKLKTCLYVVSQDVIKVHFTLLRAIDLNMVGGGNGLGNIFLDFKERSGIHRFTVICVFMKRICFGLMCVCVCVSD